MLATVFLTACNSNGNKFDASGTFEATEVIVSSELNGKILSLTINEGDTVSANRVVGTVDAEGIELQKEQVEASISSLNDKTADVGASGLLQNQLAAATIAINNLLHEKQRIENLKTRCGNRKATG
jgi:HlyD family secretion protein